LGENKHIHPGPSNRTNTFEGSNNQLLTAGLTLRVLQTIVLDVKNGVTPSAKLG